MIDKLVDGIVAALRREPLFAGAKVYTEEVKQGLSEPCFMVSCVDQRSEHFSNELYARRYLFSIQYIPRSQTGGRSEFYNVLDYLFWALEFIEVDGLPTKGTRMNADHSGGVLSFFVEYSFYVRKKAARAEDMQILDLEVVVK